MPSKADKAYSPPSKNITIKLKCMSILQCIERLGLKVKDASQCFKYYNVTVLDVLHISNGKEIAKLRLGVYTSDVYNVKVRVQSEGQPRGLYKGLLGQEFENIYLGQFNYGRNSSKLANTRCPDIWYKVHHENAEKHRANQKKYAAKKPKPKYPRNKKRSN